MHRLRLARAGASSATRATSSKALTPAACRWHSSRAAPTASLTHWPKPCSPSGGATTRKADGTTVRREGLHADDVEYKDTPSCVGDGRRVPAAGYDARSTAERVHLARGGQ